MNNMEQQLTLIGCTAVEDKLQTGVPGTIDYLLHVYIQYLLTFSLV